MLTINKTAKKVESIEIGTLYFSVYDTSGGSYHKDGDTPGSIRWEKEWIIKNKCKFLGIHPVKDIEFIEFHGSYRAVINPDAIEKIKAKYPKFKQWIEGEKRFSNSQVNWDYANFSFVKSVDVAENERYNTLSISGGISFGDWLFNLDLVGVRED